MEPNLAAEAGRYRVRHCHYPYSQQYGSSQADITAASAKVDVAKDRRSVRVPLGERKAGRIFHLDFVGLISAEGRTLAHPTLCYTVNRLAK